jgi:hypothetical protein
MSLQKETEHIDKQSEQCSQDKKLEEKADRIKETEVATGKNSSNNLPLSKTENTKKIKAHMRTKSSPSSSLSDGIPLSKPSPQNNLAFFSSSSSLISHQKQVR